jgi:hypothetical protein
MIGWRVRIGKFALLSVAYLMAATIAVNADSQDRPQAHPQQSALPAANLSPGSWDYDPYTHGSIACPQGGEDGPNPGCNVLIPPSQPNR